MNEEIVKRLDEDRIKKALEDGNYCDAFVLFKYSSLSKEEFGILQQRHPNDDVFKVQMKEYFKQKNKERIEKAFLDHQDKAAEYIYKTSELTEKEFNEIKTRFSVPEKNDSVRKPKTEEEINPKEDSWGKILDFISKKISKPSFDTWIKETEAIIEENKITVYAKNEFQRDWLEERYHNLISATVEELLGKEYKVVFKVG